MLKIFFFGHDEDDWLFRLESEPSEFFAVTGNKIRDANGRLIATLVNDLVVVVGSGEYCNSWHIGEADEPDILEIDILESEKVAEEFVSKSMMKRLAIQRGQ